jgi:hypothetical protein
MSVTRTEGSEEARRARRISLERDRRHRRGSTRWSGTPFVETGEKEKEQLEPPPLRPLPPPAPPLLLPSSILNPNRLLAPHQAPPSRAEAVPERSPPLASTCSKRTPSSPRRSSNARPLLSSPLFFLSMLGLLLHRLILRSVPWLRLHLNRPILSSSVSRRSVVNTSNVSTAS